VRHPWDGPLSHGPTCPGCGEASLRPDIVWFGEIPYGLELVEEALWECDLFVSIGTSGVVYPAAAFVHWARGETLELNLEPSAGASDFAQSRQGPATRLVPDWVAEVLGSAPSASR
jgi:NAD-dependent deacetylase